MNGDIIFSQQGYCLICEKETVFTSKEKWFRDHLICNECFSIPRERALMKILNDYYPNWSNLSVYESSPGGRGVSLRLHKECINYVASHYYENTGKGTVNPDTGYRCEDLENLTFSDNCFDIVITQDVIEHLFEPEKAFKEIARVLKKGGAHIFTVPIVNKTSISEKWATKSGDNIIYHHEPEWHGNPIDPFGSLVCTHWGYDIASLITKTTNMPTVIFSIDNIDLGIRAEYIEVLASFKY